MTYGEKERDRRKERDREGEREIKRERETERERMRYFFRLALPVVIWDWQ